jgi:aromatic-L-amino-acid decarboxylase
MRNAMQNGSGAIRQHSPFVVPEPELVAAFSQAGAFVAREFVTPTARPVLPGVPRELFDEIIEGALPEEGLSLAAISARAQDFLARYTARLLPAGFSAMVTTSPNPYALLADILACAVNQHLARGDVGEFGSRLEERVIGWVGEFMGCPGASGILTGGGASANLIALAAARRATLGPEVRRRGLNGAQLVAYASSETHISTERAIDVLGIGVDNLRKLPVDDRFRLRVDALENAIREDRAAGRVPFAVIAQGGSVATGAVDPLVDIAAVCSRQRLWLHVDAAYGGPAAAVEPALFAGLASADSVTVDPHKWLYVNYECGCLLVKAKGVLESAFGAEGASYLRADTPNDAPDYMSRGIDFSRGLRALKIWATFAGLGAAQLKRAISQDIRHASLFHDLLARNARFELCAPLSLSIVVFRFVPEAGFSRGYLDALNGLIPAALRRDGRIYFGSTVLGDRVVLRVCLINHRVTDGDLAAWIDIVTKVGNDLHNARAQWWQEDAVPSQSRCGDGEPRTRANDGADNGRGVR